MVKVVGVRFKDNGKTYYFDPKNLDIKKDQTLVVETANGLECGTAQYAPKLVEDDEVVAPLRRVNRIATQADLKTLEENRALEKQALKVCEQKVAKHRLEMNLVACEYSLDRSKIVFFFTADGRVDFRELVKDLANHYKARIELRQIGVRDESRMIGGLGVCGRPFCCSTFLHDFHSVTIKMAKDQGLSLAPGKISGTCGRLMCCLQYEQESYEHLNKITPKKGAYVECREGRGTVLDASLLTGWLKVQLDSTPDGLPFIVRREDVKVLGKCKGCPKGAKAES